MHQVLNQPLISVVVPVYNSAAIVEELCKRLKSVLERIAGSKFEILLVDDCSSDSVWENIKWLALQDEKIKGYRLGKNFGQWMAVLAGIKQAKGKYIVTIDDDLEYDPEDIEKLYRAITNFNYHLVFGLAPDKYRVKNANTLNARFRNKFLNFLWQKFITDSYKIFRREVLFNNETFAAHIHFEAFIKHTLHPKFVGYEEVGYHSRFEGYSNHTLGKKIGLFLQYSIEYYRTPVLFVALFFYFFFGVATLLEYFIFNGKLNGVLNMLIGLAILSLSLLILHYVSNIYRSVRHIPDYWIIEQTSAL